MSSETSSPSESTPPALGAASEDAPRTKETRVHTIGGWKRMIMWPLGLLARIWNATLRFEGDPESLRIIRKIDETVAIILWHNRLFVIGEVFKRFREPRSVYGLVSASKDGAFLAEFFRLVGIKSVRGSSTHNARESVSLLVKVMQDGHDIGITPDGPKGPMYDFKGGGIIVARRVHSPVIMLGIEFERAWQLRSWDRFYIPHPFSRVRISCKWLSPEEVADRSTSLEKLRGWLCEVNPDRPAKEKVRIV